MEHMVGQLLALIIALCWAQNSLIYSHVGRQAGSRSVAHIRLWIALPMILLLNVAVTGTVFPMGYSTATYGHLLISGLLGFFIADLLIFRAYVDLGPRETLVILTSSPIYTTIISRIFINERITFIQVIGIIITVAGVMWVVYTESQAGIGERKGRTRGLVIAMLGSLAQAVAMVFSKAGMAEGIHPISANLLRISAGFVGLVIYAVVRGSFRQDFRALRSVKLLALVASAALVGPILGIVLTLYAITLAPVGVITAITQISPVLLLPIEHHFYRKKISLSTILGTFTAIAGAVILVIH
jgi:drug/metabolite transporter (DMT)-like permease